MLEKGLTMQVKALGSGKHHPYCRWARIPCPHQPMPFMSVSGTSWIKLVWPVKTYNVLWSNIKITQAYIMVLVFLNHIKKLYPGLPWWSSGMNLLAYAGEKGVNPGPHVLEQLSPWATTTEPVLQSLWASTTELTYLNYWSLWALGPSGPNYWEGML